MAVQWLPLSLNPSERQHMSECHWTHVESLAGEHVRVCSCGWESSPAYRLDDLEGDCAVAEEAARGARRSLARQARLAG